VWDREGGSDHLKAGLKFCGGCRAGYDRVGLARSIRERLAGKIEWIAADREDVEEILIVCGCKTACVKLDATADLPVHHITSPEEAERWIAGIHKRIR
jgi:hypothetical protein